MGIKTLSATVISGLTLFAGGCEANADAKDKPNEAVRVASMNVITQAKTQADCLKLGLESDAQIVSCMTEVGERILQASKDEIAALNKQEEAIDADNAALDGQESKLDTDNAALDDEIDKGRTTVKGLTKVVALQKESGRD